jgi:hypothetical protein
MTAGIKINRNGLKRLITDSLSFPLLFKGNHLSK